ncbi:hypothetical protein P8452_04340 [Trifolium repens]|nr:hypothetical protein P8452_04340 [Trifolium repens]
MNSYVSCIASSADPNVVLDILNILLYHKMGNKLTRWWNCSQMVEELNKCGKSFLAKMDQLAIVSSSVYGVMVSNFVDVPLCM